VKLRNHHSPDNRTTHRDSITIQKRCTDTYRPDGRRSEKSLWRLPLRVIRSYCIGKRIAVCFDSLFRAQHAHDSRFSYTLLTLFSHTSDAFSFFFITSRAFLALNTRFSCAETHDFLGLISRFTHALSHNAFSLFDLQCDDGGRHERRR
jgi:hypothetical protein